jgi:ribose transport system permease protein
LTFKSTLSQNVVTGLISIGLVVPIVTGVYDLSIGYSLGMGSTLVAVLSVNDGYPVWLAVVVALAAGVLIGVINGILVVVVKIDSFIATLGMGSILAAIIWIIGNNSSIVGLNVTFNNIANDSFLGITVPVYLLFVVAIVVWYVLEQTPAGRYFQATGGGRDAARLAGIQTERFIFMSFIVSAVLGTVAGIVLTGQLATSSPDFSTEYLLPAFATVFLGATQIKNGRPNVWGTLLAVYALGIGAEGFNLVGVAPWRPPTRAADDEA